ncbi:hypothetical protein U9M48_001337 [Paspalum notatum var. saurae]|uniref:MADS-box domain-containing protein n=1 Tax=Paspalum notatum var. saurae TaxID=547442 RepID=A0AAQ3PFT2_PASNO
MGRVKLKIKKLENSSGRQVTYSKRRSGIVKKAKELAILCDIDLILLMFSPTEKPTIYMPDNRKIDHIIERYAQLTPQERAKRLRELSSHLGSLQCQMADAQKRLSYWSDPDKVDNIDHIRAMEQSLKESLNRIRIHKENIAKQHLIGLQCAAAAQFQTDMQLPLGLTGDPGPSSWFQHSSADGQQTMMLPDDPSLLHQRDIGCSTSASLQSYAGYFGMPKQETETGGGGEHGQPMVHLPHPDFSQADCLTSLHLGAQLPYAPFDHSGLFSERMFRPDAMEMHDGSAGIDFGGGHFDLPRPGDEASFQNWASAACGAAMFDHHQPQQQHHQQPQSSSSHVI